MTKWNEIVSGLRTLHPHAREVVGELRVTMVCGGIRVGVHVRPVGNCIAVLAEIGAHGAFDPIDVLGWNAALSTDAIALVDSTYVVRAIVEQPISALVVDEHIQRATKIAATVKAGVRRPHNQLLFAHYAA